jgi:FkbM family methyltransferase
MKLVRPKKPKKSRDPGVEARSTFLREAAQYTSHLTAETEFGTFLISTHERKVSRQIFEQRRIKDASVMSRVVSLLDRLGERRGALLIDVGANIGTSTVSALRSGSFSRTVSIEPDPANFLLLRANTLLNRLDGQVTCVCAAVSDAPGRGQLARHSTNSGAHELVHGDIDSGAGFDSVIEVETTTLDTLTEAGIIDETAVGLLWMDVQGREGHALHGATRLVSRGTPALLELFPAALRRSGGLGLLHRSAEGYRGFLDIRPLLTNDETLSLRPISDLPELIDSLGDERHTDILLVA